MNSIIEIYQKDAETAGESIRFDLVPEGRIVAYEEAYNQLNFRKIRKLFILGSDQERGCEPQNSPGAIVNDENNEVLFFEVDGEQTENILRKDLRNLQHLLVKYTDRTRLDLQRYKYLSHLIIKQNRCEMVISSFDTLKDLIEVDIHNATIPVLSFCNLTNLRWLIFENVKLEEVELREHLEFVQSFKLNHVSWPSNTTLSNVRGFLPPSCIMENDGERVELCAYSPQLPGTDLRWERFAVNAGDVHKDFEELCTQFCRLEYFDRDTMFAAIPNNPGIEWHPMAAAKGKFEGKRIGMQAKYFEGKPDKNGYKEILDSVKRTVENYFNERPKDDVIQVLILFCNKKLSQSDKSGKIKNQKDFREAKKLLDDVGIQLQVIDEKDLLNCFGKYLELQERFFHKD